MCRRGVLPGWVAGSTGLYGEVTRRRRKGFAGSAVREGESGGERYQDRAQRSLEPPEYGGCGEHPLADRGARPRVEYEHSEGHEHEDPAEPDEPRVEQSRWGVQELREEGEEEHGELRVQEVKQDPAPDDGTHGVCGGALVLIQLQGATLPDHRHAHVDEV